MLIEICSLIEFLHYSMGQGAKGLRERKKDVTQGYQEDVVQFDMRQCAFFYSLFYIYMLYLLIGMS